MNVRNRTLEPEWLDTLPAGDPRAVASRRDLGRLNGLMSQARLMIRLLQDAAPPGPPRRILDLGGGDGTFMLRVAHGLARRWPGVTVVVLDREAQVSAQTRDRFTLLGWRIEPLRADVFDALKTAPQGIDAVTANLFLHHLSRDELKRLFALVSRVAPVFVACEPRRAVLALQASRLVGLIGCNDVTRHDAVASVRAGFRDAELGALWPDRRGWTLSERAAGLFSHGFSARHARELDHSAI